MSAFAGTPGPLRTTEAPVRRSAISTALAVTLVIAAVETAILLGAATGLFADQALLVCVALMVVTGAVAVLIWPSLAIPLGIVTIWLNLPGIIIDKGAPGFVAAAIPAFFVLPLAMNYIRGARAKVDPIFLALLGLLLAQVVATIASSEQTVALNEIFGFATEGLLLYFLVYNVVRTRKTLAVAIWSMLGATTFLALVTVFQQITGTVDRPYFGFSPLDGAYFVGKSDVARAYGPLGDPNYYAQILVAAVAVAAICLYRVQSRPSRCVLASMIGVMTLAIAFTYSRGAVLALAVVVLIMVFLGYVKVRHVVALGMSVVLLMSIIPGYSDRLSTLTNLGGLTAETGSSDAEADIAARRRTTENLAALKVFEEHPLVGVGPGAFPAYYQEYATKIGGDVHEAPKRDNGETKAGVAPEREAHNLFLAAAAELGILGVLALAGIIVVAFSQANRARKALLRRGDDDMRHMVTALAVALAGYLTAGIFLTLAFERYLWLLLALLGASAWMGRGGHATDPEAGEASSSTIPAPVR